MKSLLLPLSLLFSSFLFAQKELSPGDPAPEKLWSYLSSFNNDTLNPANLKGKLVIFDFWATTCTSCMGAFPKIDSLQKLFKGKVQFVLVTKEPKEKVDKVMGKFKKIKMPAVPSITSDTLLSGLFFHITVPHHVWIDKDGLVRAITNGHNTTAKTIKTWLEGKDPNLYVKREVANHENVKPWAGDENELLYYSYVTRKSKTKHSGGYGISKDKATNKIIGISSDPTSITELYKLAFNPWGTFKFRENNRLILEVKNPGDYVQPEDLTLFDRWAEEHRFGYFLKIPLARADDLYKIMQQDLERIFGLKGSVEKRKVKCLALVRISNEEKYKSKGGDKFSRYIEEEHKVELVNWKMTNLASEISFHTCRNLSTPVVDQTNYKGNIDFQIVLELGNVQLVKDQLRKYGLDLVEKELVQEMLVLREKGYK